MTLLNVLTAGAILVPAVALAAAPADPADPVRPPGRSAGVNSTIEVASAPPPTSARSTSNDEGGGLGAGTPIGRWNWPLQPVPSVLRGFKLGPMPWSPGHRGVDLATRAGTVVRAPADGVISYVGVLVGRPVLSIDHGDGLVSSFEPVISRLPRGARVRQGEAVGELAPGVTHCVPDTCLHWGVRSAGRYIDPLALVPRRRMPAVLLPMLPMLR